MVRSLLDAQNKLNASDNLRESLMMLFNETTSLVWRMVYQNRDIVTTEFLVEYLQTLN